MNSYPKFITINYQFHIEVSLFQLKEHYQLEEDLYQDDIMNDYDYHIFYQMLF